MEPYYLFGKDCAGPLKGDHAIETSSLVTNNIPIPIIFLGDTYAGKSRLIESVVNALGGYFEEQKCAFRGRTRKNDGVIFAYSFDGVRPVRLLSMAGDLLAEDAYRAFSKESLQYIHNMSQQYEYAIVLKYQKSTTLARQVRHLSKLTERLKIEIRECPTIITRIENEDEMSARRRNPIKKIFPNLLYADNHLKPSKVTLDNLPKPNLELIMRCLWKKDPSLKLINFGQKTPESITDLVISNKGIIEPQPVPADIKISWKNSYRELRFGNSWS